MENKGYWKPIFGLHKKTQYQCSNCYKIVSGQFSKCPYCGDVKLFTKKENN